MPKVLLVGNISNKRKRENFYLTYSSIGPKKSQIKRKVGLKLVSELQATVLGNRKGSHQSGKYKLETEYVFISDTELIFKP